MKRLLLVLAIAATPWLLLACGGDDDPTTTDAGATATARAEETSVGASVSGGTPATADPGSPVAPSSETPIPPATETVTSTYAIPTSQLPLVSFEGAAGSVELPVELPPRSEYAIGLSGRTSLEGRGMVFYREDFGETGFWMQNTHIDLDIAFVNSDREIVLLTTMFADTLDIHRPDEPYVVAIEAPAGWYTEHGVEQGSTVEYLFDLDALVSD